MVITYIRGLITPLLTTHEPPSNRPSRFSGGGLLRDALVRLRVPTLGCGV